MKWLDRLMEMEGRLALASEAEAECLAYYAAIPGDYIEIGTLWGGTALIAGLAKEDSGTLGDVYTIDRMRGGWWDTQDPIVKRPPTPRDVLANLARYKVAYRTHVIMSESHPWPLPASIEPTVIFIDGDHSREGCLQDWHNAKTRARYFVLFHDYASSKHPGVQSAVDAGVITDPDWQHVKTVGTIAVFSRIDNSLFARPGILQELAI